MVRFAEDKDLARISVLRKQVNNLHVEGMPDVFKAGFGPELQKHAAVLLNEENSDILVAERNGVICGMACVDYVYKPETPYTAARSFYHVHELAVDEAYRRQGIATELFAFMKADAAKRKLARIELDVWAFNTSAVEFYSAMGVSPTRIWMECEL